MSSASDSPDGATGVERVLVVAAHPDDVDFGAAATIATWTDAGIDVSYCVCTSGGASAVADTPREQVPGLREDEQRAAAKEVGVSDVVFLGYPDGELEATPALRRDIARQIRRVRPQRVLAWSPEINWDRPVTAHPDHRASGLAAFAAVYPDAGNPYAYPELLAEENLQPWSVTELWLADSPAALPKHAVDVTATFERKLAALRAHRSQTGSADGLAELLRTHFTGIATRHGLPQGSIAEEFQIVRFG